MARLFEYQGKQLLREAGLKTPPGWIVSDPAQVQELPGDVRFPVMLKAQVWTTGRKKAGGILTAGTCKAAATGVESLLHARIKGHKVREVLIEEKEAVSGEFYLSITIDDSYRVRSPVMIFSSLGGIEIEEAAARSPEIISRIVIDPLQGLSRDQLDDCLQPFHLQEDIASKLMDVMTRSYSLFSKVDARSLEINPLVVTDDQELVAVDCRISIDDASVYRHPELGIEVARESDSQPTELDRMGWQIEKMDYRGSSFFAEFPRVENGSPRIGFHAIGGGGALLAADTLVRKGLALANFAETSGNPPASKVYRIVRTILEQDDLDGYCLLGPVMASQDQWHHAHGLMKAFREGLNNRTGFPVVVMLAGNKEKETLDLLRQGLDSLPIRYALFGRDYLYQLDVVADQLRAFVDEYRIERNHRV